jgi:hypothetical protein
MKRTRLAGFPGLARTGMLPSSPGLARTGMLPGSPWQGLPRGPGRLRRAPRGWPCRRASRARGVLPASS